MQQCRLPRCWPRRPGPADTLLVTAGRSTRPSCGSPAGTLRLPRSRPVRAGHRRVVSARRDAKAVRRFFERAIGTTAIIPVEVVTDQAAAYPAVLGELLPAAWHRTEQYANNRVEADHGRLKARLRPMRGFQQTTAPGS
jgi:hypothetical protein